MTSREPAQDQPLNRRDRKTLRTRRTIIRAAAELVLEESYARATLARIAERADVAVRTVTTHFPTKEAIFFETVDDAVERAEQHLRTAHGDVVDRLRAELADAEAVASVRPEDPDTRQLQSRAIAKDPDLRALMFQHFSRGQSAIAAAVAADTGLTLDAVGPQMIAASAVAMLNLIDRLSAEQSENTSTERERGLAILRGALHALASTTTSGAHPLTRR